MKNSNKNTVVTNKKKVYPYHDQETAVFLPCSTATKEWDEGNENSSHNHHRGSGRVWSFSQIIKVTNFDERPGSNTNQNTAKNLNTDSITKLADCSRMFSEGNTAQKSIEIMEISTFIIINFTLTRVNIQNTRLTKL